MADKLSYFDDLSDHSSDEEEENEPPAKKFRRPTRNWCEQEEFSSAAEAENAVKIQGQWRKCSSKNTPLGKRIEYRCTKGQYRKSECPAGLYLLYHNTSSSVSLYETENEHEHTNAIPTRGLSAEIKEFVREKYADGHTKPNKLLELIRKNINLVEPEKAKLVRFLGTLNKENGNPSISANEIITWCNERIQTPEDEDEPFVIDFHILAESFDVEDQDIKIVISTPRLLALAKKFNKLVQTDATYKLIWQGHPFLLLGTSDANYTFHPFAVAITKGESEKDFEFIFRAVSKAIPDWKPSVLLADGSEAITNGFTAVFGAPGIRLMCFFHMIKRVETNLRLITDVDLREQLKEDIYILQSSMTQDDFLKASQLFLKKYKKESQALNFIQYFEIEWLHKHPNWYEGAAVGVPSSNNGVEGTNAIIKDECTFRERWPVGKFLGCTINMVKNWSQRRDSKSVNCVVFSETRDVSLKLWTEAFQWAARKPSVLERHSQNYVEYFTSSSKLQTPITEKLQKEFESKQGKWRTFDSYSEWRTKIWKIVVFPDHTTCTCPFFTKKNQCKHSVGMRIRRKEVDVPPEAKNIPLGQKRKRGRPSKAKKALLV